MANLGSALARMWRPRIRSLTIAIVCGVIYSLAAFALLKADQALASMAFLIFVPVALGAVPILFTDDDQATLYRRVVFLPWIAALTYLVGLLLVFREAGICLAMLSLPVLIATIAGTLIAWIFKSRALRKRKQRARVTGVALMLLPFVLAPVEAAYLRHPQRLETTSSVAVAAPAAFVFSRLAEVATIDEREYPPGLLHHLGVPRPIRATVDRAALGGHRLGEFEYGLTFEERITTFDPPRKMGFSIDVDASRLRMESAERHAFENGYFRFVDATYDVVPVDETSVRLTLSSRYVLTTSVNWYGELWAGAIIGDFQDRVLSLLRGRIEAAAPNFEAAGGSPIIQATSRQR